MQAWYLCENPYPFVPQEVPPWLREMPAAAAAE